MEENDVRGRNGLLRKCAEAVCAEHRPAPVSAASDRKLAEPALHDREELFRSLVLNRADVTIVTDAGLVATYVSPQCRRVTGHDAEALLGRRLSDLVHPDDAAAWAKALDHLLREGGERCDLEYRIVGHDGQPRWIHHSAAALRAGDRLVGTQSSIRDITEPKQAERAAIEALERSQGARDSWAKAEKQAAIGRLAAEVAHDILNPLTIISARLRFIEEEAISDLTRKNLSTCREQVSRITKICRDLIDSAAALATPRATGDLRAAVEAGVELVQPRLEEDGVALEYTPPGDSVPVGMDVDAIARATANLLLDACDAMAGGRAKRLHLNLRREGGSAVITVSDSGRGPAEESGSRPSSRFFTARDAGIGLGVGLAISKGIIEEHGGRIRAESNEMAGTALVVELPLDQD